MRSLFYYSFGIIPAQALLVLEASNTDVILEKEETFDEFNRGIIAGDTPF